MEVSELEAQKQQKHIDGGNYQRAAPPVDEALRKERARITYVTTLKPAPFSIDDNMLLMPLLPDLVANKHFRRKLDFRLIPILGLMYAINGIDRTNLAVARIAGMEEDLGINQGERYSIALLIFFIP